MFGNWFKSAGVSPSAKSSGQVIKKSVDTLPALPLQARHLDDTDSALAVGFLCQDDSVMPMTPQDAVIVALYLLPKRFRAGEVMLLEGDVRSNYMLWVLDGDATIETNTTGPMDSITMTVVQPGSSLGHMGLMDGHQRSAICTASSAVRAAVLTRQSLRTLAARHPEVAAKLMFIICRDIAARLRDVNDKFKRFAVMTRALREEWLESAAREAGNA